MRFNSIAAGSALVALASGAACPFEQMHNSGMLDARDASSFQAVKRDPANAERLLKLARTPGAVPAAEDLSKRDDALKGLNLTMGGGLLNGALQPLTGALSKLDIPTPQPQGLKAIPGNDPEHQFIAPGQGDVRGICPTLNALANHGYLSRDGITSFAEAANAVQTGYGFGYGLSVFLSALGLLAGGDLLSGKYSIGGADSRVPNTLGLSPGLDSHGVFEIDGSITRQDVHFGNNANFLKQRWDEYVDTANKYGGLFNEQANAEDNGNRYDNSRATNPEFFAGAIWFAVSHAERVFVYQGLPNGTNQTYADYANVSPFFLDERFPENWFRRGSPFSLPSAFMEAAAMFLLNPREIGGNEGLNNFVPLGLDLSQDTPAQLGCFLLENMLDLIPGQIKNAAGEHFDLYEGFVKGVVAPFMTDDGFFNCKVSNFARPSASAGNYKGAESSSGSPVDGAYPGIGVIKPDSQPS